jgi:hypothetical protein
MGSKDMINKKNTDTFVLICYLIDKNGYFVMKGVCQSD